MAIQCPACSKANPADARYCHYDGRALSHEHGQGPLRVGSLPFIAPFYFPDGQTCANFNQLALACANRWDEARSLLVEGVWGTFFMGIGRLDLVAVAKQAAGDPDPDRGLSRLLENLPADPDCLRPAKVAVESSQENLGQLRPGTDRSFELVVVNQGMLLLHGTIVASCDWLAFGDRNGPTEKLFQTRDFFSLRVWVLGNKLRAGLVPLQADIAIETNGGTAAVSVRADVPIVPFPKGAHGNEVLAGARSPRELALKAKEHPNEAAVLFEQGVVKGWYASNGWTYPVEGTVGSGKGAVQQFFEALGLTKPPRLEVSPTTLALKAKSGERLSKVVTVRTEESKPVYAQAWSDQEWLTVGTIKYRGNVVTVPLEVLVPPHPGETVFSRLTILGNGKQRFQVQVSVKVERAPGPHDRHADRGGAPTGAAWWLRWAGLFAAGFFVTGVLLVIGALLVRLAFLGFR